MFSSVKDFHREKAPSNNTLALTKSINMDTWVAGTSNQLFKEVLKLKQNFQKNKVVTGKAPFFVIGQFSTHHSICLNAGFWCGSFVWKWCMINLGAFNRKTILQSFEKCFCIPENVSNVQNFHLLSLKNMPISQTVGYLENP